MVMILRSWSSDKSIIGLCGDAALAMVANQGVASGACGDAAGEDAVYLKQTRRHRPRVSDLEPGPGAWGRPQS